MECHEIINLIVGIANLGIAATVAYYGYQLGQSQTALTKDSMRLSLMERRLKLFDATREYMDHILVNSRNGQIDPVKVNSFRLVVMESEFLFHSDVTNVLQKLFDAPFLIDMHEQAMKDYTHGTDSWKTHLKGHYDLMRELLGIQKQLTAVFKPYLNFSTYRS